MFNIVLEGPDGSGKSTLAQYVMHELTKSYAMTWDTYQSPGPDKSEEQYTRRAEYCLSRTQTVFDRHPVVSELIYGTARGKCFLTEPLSTKFYNQRPLIIYCAPIHGTAHTTKAHDTREHIDLITRRYDAICNMYRMWAQDYAQLMYRIGDDKERLLHMIKGAIDGH